MEDREDREMGRKKLLKQLLWNVILPCTDYKKIEKIAGT